MTIVNENIIQTFKPTVRGIITILLGTLFMGWIFRNTFIVLQKNTNGNLDYMITYGIATFFLCLLIGFIYYLLTIKVIHIDKYTLTIRYPLLFYKKEIAIASITNKDLSPFIIRYARNWSAKSDPIYEGKRIVVFYDNNKKVEINSFQTEKFDLLKKTLFNYINSSKQ